MKLQQMKNIAGRRPTGTSETYGDGFDICGARLYTIAHPDGTSFEVQEPSGAT